tara:strand:- start:604 stop:1422 length:819 start_codon:yes stop_codon:yes gene_type:complete
MLRFSTYEEAFDELLENEGLKKKAAKSGISYGTLKKVYNRGMAAWRTGHRPGTTPQQWGMARVNSYITKGKGTYYGADSDLSGKGKKKEKKEGYVSMAQQRAVWATRKDGGKGHPDNKKKKSKKEDVNEISKTLAKNYISKASRDTYHLGQKQGKADAIDRLGGTHPDQKYKGGPERKAVKRVVGIDRAAQRIATGKGYYGQKKEAMSDVEKKAHDAAIAAFKAKGGKIKKLKPGYAQGYHGKSDPAAGMKGMMDKGDTRAIGTRKKVGSMK